MSAAGRVTRGARARALRRARGCARGCAARDAGAVTAELALALPAVVLVLAVLLVTAAAGAAQLRTADAARTGARLAALGHTDAEVVAAARHVAGGADVRVLRDPPWVVVEVVGHGAGAWFTAGPLAVSASATAWVEP